MERDLQEGEVGIDALALELKEVVVFGGTSCPLRPTRRERWVAGGVGSGFAESLFGADPAEAGAGVDAFEFAPSLCVFGKIWATDGREFEIDASKVNPGKSLFMSGLANPYAAQD